MNTGKLLTIPEKIEEPIAKLVESRDWISSKRAKENPGYVGAVLVTCEFKDITIYYINEFKIELLDGYFERSLNHCEFHIE